MSKLQGTGVEVVQVKGLLYELDTVGLKKILLRDGVKNLPVVVVSVAGAFRGGKSFLLNFFLRYLMAPQSSQADGSWLGVDNIPLEGFSWRGGSQRNTTGIVIWSEPLITNLATGEQVAVILMDTQGTFDSSSTVRDSSTIFALSTLLSSIQIYNLSHNIREDDLQHLQLFTEYGRLIRDQSGTAFQVLQFLIRNWQNPSEYSYGSSGGRLYLEKTFPTNAIQGVELSDLRAHICGSFTALSCFLMPHPGENVAEADFKGRVNEISNKFKTYVHELSSHLFSPGQLLIKKINGQPVTASELYTYFETYMSVFNSDTIPTPTTVYEATAKAGLLAAFEEGRRIYETGMDADCGLSQPTVPGHDLKDRHELHANKALSYFKDKKKMGSKDQAKEKHKELKEELEKRLPEFIEINMSKYRKMIKDASEAYDSKIGLIKAEKSLCVHPLDLDEVHITGCNAAIQLFDQNRKYFSMKEDTEKEAFIKDFEKQYELLKLQNDQNNKMAVKELRLEYWTTMESKFGETALSESEFLKEHRLALEEALKGFAEKRNRSDCHEKDEYKESLIESINEKFVELQSLRNGSIRDCNVNRRLNTESCQSSSSSSVSDSSLSSSENSSNTSTSSSESRISSSSSDDSSSDSSSERGVPHLPQELQMINSRFAQMKEINQSKNRVALQAAIKAYEDYMASAWDSKKVCIHPAELDTEHGEGERRAITAFRPNKVSTGRVFFDTTDDDEKLLAKILQERFKEIEENNSAANETEVQAAFNKYSEDMYFNCGFSGWWLLFGVPYIVNKTRRNKYHDQCKSDAVDKFYTKRHGNSRSRPDSFMDKLESKIATERKKY